MKKAYVPFIASAFVVGVMFSCGFSAYATTVDDVAAVARSYGYSEEDIQAGYNEYYSHPGDYPSERLDMAIEKLNEAGSQIITTGPQLVEPVVTTTAVISNDKKDDPVTDPTLITLTASDGSTFTRISREAFIQMSYDEKMAYLQSFPPVQQQAFIDDLSPEEYRSLMKQSPADKKIQIVDKLSQAAEEMGLNITVDELTDDSLTLAMRNDKGELVNISTAGAAVEDTGYDRRGILAAAGLLIGTALTAVYLLIRHMRSEGTEQ